MHKIIAYFKPRTEDEKEGLRCDQCKFWDAKLIEVCLKDKNKGLLWLVDPDQNCEHWEGRD